MHLNPWIHSHGSETTVNSEPYISVKMKIVFAWNQGFQAEFINEKNQRVKNLKKSYATISLKGQFKIA
jgi:hypothetical protein